MSQALDAEFGWTCRYDGFDYSITVVKFIYAMRTKIPSDCPIAKGTGQSLAKAFESCLQMAESGPKQ